MNILIKDHQIGVDFWNSKRELFEKFYGAFYQFILEHGGKDDLESHNVKSVEDFYNYADWNAEEKIGAMHNLKVYYPELVLCTDNAAMIASAGYYNYMAGERSDWDLNAVPNLKIGER